MSKSHYQETYISFDLLPDLYAIHRRVMAVTDGDKAITYSPMGVDSDGRMAVALRSMAGTEFPDGLAAQHRFLEDGMVLNILAGVRMVKRSDRGERMPTKEEAVTKWLQMISAGGFKSESVDMHESSVAFYHQRLEQHTRLPFWAVSGTLTVMDAENAAKTMVRGVGRNRGLGFGMLIEKLL